MGKSDLLIWKLQEKCYYLSFSFWPLLQVYEDFSHIICFISLPLIFDILPLPFISTLCRGFIFFPLWWEAQVMSYILTMDLAFTLHRSLKRLSFIHVPAWSLVTTMCIQRYLCSFLALILLTLHMHNCLVSCTMMINFHS